MQTGLQKIQRNFCHQRNGQGLSGEFSVQNITSFIFYRFLFLLKAIYNVWKDKEDWLQSIEGVQAILATTVDPVTENIFYIIEDDFMTLSEFLKKSDDTLSCIFDLDKNGREDEIQELGERVKRILRQIETMRLTFILSSIDQILVRGSNIFLQNPLLTKRLLGIQIHILFCVD